VQSEADREEEANGMSKQISTNIVISNALYRDVLQREKSACRCESPSTPGRHDMHLALERAVYTSAGTWSVTLEGRALAHAAREGFRDIADFGTDPKTVGESRLILGTIIYALTSQY
jgi:hypothetical protein